MFNVYASLSLFQVVVENIAPEFRRELLLFGLIIAFNFAASTAYYKQQISPDFLQMTK